jgi:hypothetical protein
LPTSWFDKAADRVRNLKESQDDEDASTLKINSKRREVKQIREEIESKRQESKLTKDEIEKIKDEIESKRQESKQTKVELDATNDPAERSEHEKRERRIQQEISRLRTELRDKKEKDRAKRSERKRRKKTAQQELLRLERELRATEDETAATTGALPDFVVIGGKKCGTTFFYHLLNQHPLVQPAAAKELHFFDALFDKEDTEWYRQCFPRPKWKDGQKTITGEASPYMAHRLAPERMANVVPQARIIAVLRNPVDRAYSDYQMVAGKGREPRTFEEAVGLEGDGASEGGEDRARSLDEDSEYLSRGVYVDQLLRWSEFFPKEQLLVLKSEDFFEHPLETLKTVQGFLDLPEWEPRASELPKKRNEGKYEEGIDPATRRLLEEYFEPHNQRLYDFLGLDFGW